MDTFIQIIINYSTDYRSKTEEYTPTKNVFIWPSLKGDQITDKDNQGLKEALKIAFRTAKLTPLDSELC